MTLFRASKKRGQLFLVSLPPPSHCSHPPTHTLKNPSVITSLQWLAAERRTADGTASREFPGSGRGSVVGKGKSEAVERNVGVGPAASSPSPVEGFRRPVVLQSRNPEKERPEGLMENEGGRKVCKWAKLSYVFGRETEAAGHA